MGSTSQPGPGIYVGDVCIVEAPRKPRAHSTRSKLTPIPSPSYPPQQHKQPTPQAEIYFPDTKHIAEKNVVVSCVHDKS